MHTLFLVEDEPLIRENIRNAIVNSNEPYVCIGEASDGELALSIIQDLKPDILLTDIKMPFMDGITLARHAKAIIPWIRIIIISGHDEFELAQQAIRIGVDNYLLKPVTEQDLFEALHKTSDLIIQHKKQSTSYLKDISDEEMLRTALMSAFLEQICSGEISVDETILRSKELGIDIISKQYAVMIMLAEGKGGYPSRQILASKIKFLLTQNQDVLYFMSGIDTTVFIIKGSTEQEIVEKAYNTAQTIKHEIEDDGSLMTTISISSVINRISGIRDAYHEACLLLKTFGQTNRGKIFCTGDIEKLDSTKTSVIKDLFNLNLENRIKFAVPEDIPVIIEDFTKNLDANELHNFLYRYYILMDLINIAIHIIQTFNPDMDPNKIASYFANLEQVFKSAISLDEFKELATQICLKTIELRNVGNSSHHVKLVRRACEYIQKHYNSPDISLNTVAAHVGLSPAHFSTIFSQEMAKTFIEYLTDIRIEKTKELLATTDEKIINIAFNVGYNEPNYLSYLFKKREGLTLKEYRLQKRPLAAKFQSPEL
ncbi:response regulator [Gracilinema caldarium]|uniref:Two component transcriptional regulator, AraC family n=1 Tax=Gracilinema caldarium (strain ATCC 51460 / DSM 7334 / H1) TaxID=744872 RepID=F8F3R4_GRAC1|nr:response regulator [Gracilinema caldarium]AEJ20433.1 two component transcriptional regulator, AraC family [Gracilinema caldarium DSM 7334]